MTRNALLFFAFLPFFIQGCTPTVMNRGQVIEADGLARIKTGFHTYSDVLRFIGSPTVKAPFDANTWYYIEQKTEKKGILDENVVKERIVRVAFDDRGVVQSVEDVSVGRLKVPISEDVTPTHGNEYSFMQQLLGNVGRFNPNTEGN